MKYFSPSYLLLSATLLLFSCKPIEMINLDPIVVRDNAPGAKTYRGSYPRVSDLLNTRLDIKFDWDSAFVIGTANIQAKPYFYPSDKLVLDANGFRIKSVLLVKGENKLPLKYAYDGKKLDISLDRVYTASEQYSVFIDYVAMPNKLKVGKDIGSSGDRGIYFINKDGKDSDKPRQIWTQGETECNSTWFPTINDPQEKMAQELHITVPAQYVTLSNGLLEYSSLNGDGTRTDTWRQEQIHSTYLTMLAVGDFTITKDTWREKEVSYYTEPAFASTARLVFGKTPEMMDFFSDKLGVEYPWEKYSQIVVRDFVSGAMENTTATVFFDRMNMSEGQYLDQNHEDIIAHELFHHWFGDLVTAESWSNLPLNESFATYGEYLWEEHKYGRDAADRKGYADLMIYLSGAGKKQANVIRFDYADREQMFDEISYHKGGRILHMLRKTVGDEAFFKSLNLYLTRYAYKNAEIHDLRLIFEEVSGKDLNWFFNQWFLASGHPILKINHSYNSAKQEIQINIEQNQDLSKVPLYTLPIAVDIYSNGTVMRKEIVLTKQSQTFIFPSQIQPDLVNVDAEKSILGEKTEMKSLSEYIFQYKNAPLFMDRREALIAMLESEVDPQAQQTILGALKDPDFQLRQLALEILPALTPALQKNFYEEIKEIGLKDPSSHVRAAAILSLAKVYSGMNNSSFYEQARRDISPMVQHSLKQATGK